MATRVFLAHTPLHILFSLSLIQQAGGTPAHLLVSEDFAAARRVVAGLPALLPPPHRVHLLPGKASFPGLQRLPLTQLTNHLPLLIAARRGCALTRPLSIERVHIFNDLRPDMQHIAGCIKARQPDCRIIYVEDGASSYVDTLQPWLRGGKRFRRLFRLVYGPHVQPGTSLGQFRLLEAATVIHPDHANHALRRLPLTPLPAPGLDRDGWATLSGVFGGAPPRLDDSAPVTLLCLPHSLMMTPALLDRFRRVGADYAARGMTVLVKLHPRETEDAAVMLDNAAFIPVDRAVPAEILVAWLGSRLHAVVSGYSTILYTAGWLSPGVRAVLLEDAGVPFPPELMALLRAVGVTTENGASLP